MESVLTLANLLSLVTLTGLEIILGIDNVIFIAIIVQHLPVKDRAKVRTIGLGLALVLRIAMLFCASWIIGLKEPLFTLFDFPFSGRSLLLIAGGAFLIIKPVIETIEMFQEAGGEVHEKPVRHFENYRNVILQIIFIDLVLSFDSIITAVGMTNNMPVIITAIIIAMVVMLVSSKPISEFIYANPSIKIIALSFILLVGVVLVAAGFEIEIPKGYLYFAMAFSMVVETLNILLRKKQQALKTAARE